MKRAVLAIAAAFALATGPLAGVALAQEGAGAPAGQQSAQPELPEIEVAAPKKGKQPSQAEQDAAALARAPALIAAAKINCTPTAARAAGSFNQNNAQGKKVNFDAIELACQNDIGYMLFAFEKSPVVQGRDCIIQHTGSRGATDPLACKLPANLPVQKFLQPKLTAAGNPCQATDVRAIGETASSRYYEFTCASGVGVVLSDPKAEGKAETPSCLQTPSAGLTCKLTTEEQNLAPFKALATKADEKCTVDKERYVMTVTEGDVVEVACSNGTGMLVIAKAGAFVNSVPCAKSAPYKGGCTFTDIKAAQTAEVGTYTVAAKKAGYDCDVSKYGIFSGAARGQEIVELACKNRPDGAIAMFASDGSDKVFNCSRSELAGYRCNYTPVEASYPQLNSELAASGKGACKVNASRPIGANKENAFLEVACADGDPGWVIEYPVNSAKPNDIMSCGIARARGIGGCELPGNKKALGAG